MNTRVSTGQIWFAVLPGSLTVDCVLIDEVTPKTVALRREADLGAVRTDKATRYVRGDVRFVERVP